MKLGPNDFSYSTIAAGFVSVLVGYTSSAIIVYQAAITAGATPIEASSWLGVLCLSMGLLGIVLSYKYKIPIMFAWSTPGAALLISSINGYSLSAITGAFLISALLIFISGVTGLFEKLMNKIPMSLASAMLAGVLLHFALDVFIAMKTQFYTTLGIFLVYITGRKFAPRLTIVFVLLSGIIFYWLSGKLYFPPIDSAFLSPAFTYPHFSWSATISIALPLFIVTMSSQNLTGVTVLKTFGYNAPVSRLITWSGLVNLIIAPMGGFTLNLSALTAAICMGPEAHPDPEKRYTAAISSGFIYLFIGLFSGVVATLFSSFPKELTMAIAGLALFGTISNSLVHSLSHEHERESAIVTFFITASGITLFGIGSAFWGLTGGVLFMHIKQFKITSLK